MKFKGLIAAAFTPFRDDGSLTADPIPDLIEYYLSKKLAGIFVCGSTGECSSMTTEERLTVAEKFIVAAAGRLPVIVHVGSNSLAEAAILAAHAQVCGATAISAVSPSYFKPDSVETLVVSMKQIAAAAPRLPFYFYHIPALTGVNFSMTDFVRLAAAEIPNFAGLKYTDEDLMSFQRCVDLQMNNIQIMFGRDEILLAGLALGAEAGVGSTFNFAPQLYHRIIAAFERGDLAEARRRQAQSQLLVTFLQKYGGSTSKTIMNLIGRPVGPTRLPVSQMSPEKQAGLKRELQQCGLFELLG